MSKASESHNLNLSRRHLTVGAAIRDEVRRVRHQLRRDAQRHGKRAWLAAAASGLCLMLAAPMVSPSPAQAAPVTWDSGRAGQCGTDAECEAMAAAACIAGDAVACEIMADLHRDECADEPEHEDCATFATDSAEG